MDKLVCVADYETLALQKLDSNARDYYCSGADGQATLKANVADFDRFIFRPRFCVDVSKISLKTTILGEEISFPVCIAPTAMHKLAHADGEIAVAKGAADADTCYTLSTIATTSAKEIHDELGTHGLRWFQLYIFNNRSITEALVRRVEQAGFKAIVLTVDTPEFGTRRADKRNSFFLPSHLRMANFDGISFTASSHMSDQVETTAESRLAKYSRDLFDASLTWEDVKWLRSITKLPVIAKGILTAHDAKKAVEAGCSGIVVSNHGGRQLDGVSSTILALPEIAKAVNGRVEVYLDGGVRKGTDVLKALALGARCVFVGRPILWGLTVGGQQGVYNVLNILKHELSIAMKLTGVTDVKTIPGDIVADRLVACKL